MMSPTINSGIRRAGFLRAIALCLMFGIAGARVFAQGSNVELVGEYSTPGWLDDVFTTGGYAYVAESDAEPPYIGLRILDVADPSSPVVRGSYPSLGGYGIFVANHLAYIVDPGGLVILDVSDPTSPVLLGLRPCYYYLGWGDVCVSSGVAYVAPVRPASEVGPLDIFDVSDPSSPTLIRSYGWPGGFPSSVCVSGNRAYVAFGYVGLGILDVSDPSSPTMLRVYPVYAAGGGLIGVYGVHVLGDLAYLACSDLDSLPENEGGLHVVDITDPTSPSLRGACVTPGHALDVFVSGDLAYVADGARMNAQLEMIGYVQIIDVADPSRPTLIGSFQAPGYALHVHAADDLAYVTFEAGGLKILRLRNRPSAVPAWKAY